MKDAQFSNEELASMVDAITSGATLGDVAHVSQESLEAGYSLAHSLYNAGNYKDAETLFRGLCLYDHMDERFWLGLGGCRQMNGDLTGAIDAYGLGSAASALNNPAPIVHAGMCYLKLGDKQNATALFKVGAAMQSRGEADATYISKAKVMLGILQKDDA